MLRTVDDTRGAVCRVATRFAVLSHMSFRMNYNSINVLGNLRAYIMPTNRVDEPRGQDVDLRGNEDREIVRNVAVFRRKGGSATN